MAAAEVQSVLSQVRRTLRGGDHPTNMAAAWKKRPYRIEQGSSGFADRDDADVREIRQAVAVAADL